MINISLAKLFNIKRSKTFVPTVLLYMYDYKN